MSEVTAYVIEHLGMELAVRDWDEQKQFFRDLGVQIDMWETEGMCEIDLTVMMIWICEYLEPTERYNNLRAICDDMDFDEVEAFIKAEVEDWWSSRPEVEEGPERKKRRLE